MSNLYITLKDFPNGACGDASYLLAKFLKENGCGNFEYVLGERTVDFHSHAWLEKNGVIVDITADQFDDKDCHVLVTTDKSWHNQFEEEDRHVADFERYGGHIALFLQASYHHVISNIQT